MISELSAIQKIADIPNTTNDTIKFLTVQETKVILSQPDINKTVGLRDNSFCIFSMTADAEFRKSLI